ncbi:MAG: recombinase family protein [Chloroflexi bacterium]|nr:recombinase family protein [Chloroflexota bacterium]
MSKRAAIYCRVSTDKQEQEGTSLGTQEERCRAYVEQQGHQLAGVYSEAHSGADLWDRPKLSQLRERVRAGEIDVVVAYALDRFSRKQTHVAILAEEIESRGLRLEFVTEKFEDTAVGRFIRNSMAFAAEIELEKSRERSMRGKLAHVTAGKLPTWTCDLYGYATNRQKGSREYGTRVEKADEAEVVREIFGWVRDGDSLGEVVRRLSIRGVPSPSAGKYKWKSGRVTDWNMTTVRLLLKNPAYKGQSVAYRVRSLPKKRREWRPEAEWVTLPDDLNLTPALVSEDEWEVANERLSANRGAKSRNERRPYLLRGRVFCALCGSPMHPEEGRRGNPEGARYYCKQSRRNTGKCPGAVARVPLHEMEADVWETVRWATLHPDRLVREVARLQEQDQGQGQLQAELTTAKQRLADAVRKQDLLMDLYLGSEGGTADAVRRKLDRLEAERVALATKAEEAESKVATAKRTARELLSLETYVRGVAADLDTMTFEKQRQTLDRLGVRVIAQGRRWHVTGVVLVGGEAVDEWFTVDLRGRTAESPERTSSGRRQASICP